MAMFLFCFVLCACAFWVGIGVEWIRERKYRRELKIYHRQVLGGPAEADGAFLGNLSAKLQKCKLQFAKRVHSSRPFGTQNWL